VSTTARSALSGVLIGALVVGSVAALMIWGPVDLPRAEESSALLVVCAVPDEAGTEVAGLAFAVDSATGEVTATDPFAAGTVSGTSAQTPREALPFGGGAAVAGALGPQTGEPDIAWAVLPATEWSALIDEVGGIDVDVPVSVSTYADGELTALAPGRGKLTGAEAVALASAAGHLDETARRAVIGELTASVGSIVARSGSRLGDLVGEGSAASSLSARDVPDLNAGP